MKTAISLSDELYAKAEETARDLGLARSQLYALALEEFLARHDREKVTERLNSVYGAAPAAPNGKAQETEAGLEAMRNLTRHDTW